MHGGNNQRNVGRSPILWLTGAALAFGIAGVLALASDVELASWIRADKLPGDLRRAITLSEAFAHGTGAAIILAAIWLSASPSRRPAVWLAVCITLTSGIAANVLKASFVRVRPHSVGKIRIQETAWFSENSGTRAPEGLASEVHPESVEPDFWDSRQRSFPSGHSATAWGLAIGLCLAFPRSAAVFLLLAVLSSLQRIASGAHFPSDVFAGAVIACLCAIAILLVRNSHKARRAKQRTPQAKEL